MAAANYDSAVATQAQRQADLEKQKLDWQRSQQLYKEQLISRQDYDAGKAAYDSAVAALNASQAQVAQARAAREQANSTMDQTRAQLTHMKDVLRKTTYTAPISGIVSYIDVRVGENVVPGIQNAQGSFLMTISDMSVVTAEVKVDETDITNVRNGQAADVTIDAVPGQSFQRPRDGSGRAGHSSHLRTSRHDGNHRQHPGSARFQSGGHARQSSGILCGPGFRPPQRSKPRTRTTCSRFPFRRSRYARRKRSRKPSRIARTMSRWRLPMMTAAVGGAKTDIQGVFVVRDKKAVFVPVQTGITGVTDIEVTSGLQEGDQIITGSYKALRSLRPGGKIKVDNSPPKHDDTSSS